MGTDSTDHTTPMQKRFGGWYVTGTHGSMRHRGNVLLDKDEDGSIDREAGANLESLPKLANPNVHLVPTSDIVALMLMEHQVQFHNFVTKASYVARQTEHYDAQMNEIFDRDKDFQSETSVRRINNAADKLVAYMLFVDEFKLTDPVRGASEFAEAFGQSAVRTQDGRSLRDLDLETRLLKHPCSYLIYTKSFTSLPTEILEVVKTKIIAVLDGSNDAPEFAHLSPQDRKNILEILTETHPLFQ